MPRRPRYSGCLYKRGEVYQLQWVAPDGTRHRESAKTTSKDEATKLLNKRLAESRAGESKVKQTTVAALIELYLSAQKARWKAETYRWTRILCEKHLEPAFGARNPASIISGDLDRFISQKKDAAISESRINRMLVILKAILRYGVRNKVLREIPEFPKPFDERPYIHTGHIDDMDFIRICGATTDKELWLEAMIHAAYIFGFRRNELTYMRVNQIDLERKLITLPAGSTKNKMPRRIVMNPDGKLTKLLAKLVKGKSPNEYVFSRDGGATPARDFRTTWNRVTAGVTSGSGPGGKLHFHDLRRSAITRMASAGLTEQESMAIAGHLSSAVHRRYNQISEWDARIIAAKIDK
ncbi:MAG TPA: site-specific integrase [Candidatus Acidoferrales bacterium]|nr:site-specific integrase [Candidatus Acidoferrales bacterium]